MPEKLAEGYIKGLNFAAKAATFRNAMATGLLVEVSKTGKSYKVQRDLWQGQRGWPKLVQTARHTLGTTEELTLEEAQTRAMAVIEQIKQGIDPNSPTADSATDAGALAWPLRGSAQCRENLRKSLGSMPAASYCLADAHGGF
jgi:hypothetical protein